MTLQTEVLVVGGGPTGMILAGDLARAGRSVVVLERWPSIHPSSRAFATHARTLELLDARGLADDLLPLGSAVPHVSLFAGAQLDLSQLPSRYPFVFVTPQTNVDSALARYAEQQGADIVRGWEAVALAQDDEGVTVTARPKNGSQSGVQRLFRARYVVAADGAHSTLRSLLQVPFPGRTVLTSVILADVKLSDGPRENGLTLGERAGLFGFLVPYGRRDADGSWFRTMLWDHARQVPDDAAISDAEISSVLKRAVGRDMRVAAVSWRSRFHCEERQARRYRVGRVLLVGDAAHVHSPVGGQGMNTGIQDATNLSWKLTAVLAGAPEDLLDSYERERHPIGARVVRQSGAMMRAVTLRGRLSRALRNTFIPRLLRRASVRDAIAGSFAGTGLRYARGRGEHALVGTRAAQVPLMNTHLERAQRESGFLLVRERGRDRLDIPLQQLERANAGPGLLVRPDGYIAWAGDTSRTDLSGFRAVLDRWLGAASPAAVR